MFGVAIGRGWKGEMEDTVECDIAILEAAKEIVEDEKRMSAVKEYVSKEKERLDSIMDKEYLSKIGAR